MTTAPGKVTVDHAVPAKLKKSEEAQSTAHTQSKKERVSETSGPLQHHERTFALTTLSESPSSAMRRGRALARSIASATLCPTGGSHQNTATPSPLSSALSALRDWITEAGVRIAEAYTVEGLSEGGAAGLTATE